MSEDKAERHKGPTLVKGASKPAAKAVAKHTTKSAKVTPARRKSA
jgi:hypothetical protein